MKSNKHTIVVAADRTNMIPIPLPESLLIDGALHAFLEDFEQTPAKYTDVNSKLSFLFSQACSHVGDMADVNQPEFQLIISAVKQYAGVPVVLHFEDREFPSIDRMPEPWDVGVDVIIRFVFSGDSSVTVGNH